MLIVCRLILALMLVGVAASPAWAWGSSPKSGSFGNSKGFSNSNPGNSNFNSGVPQERKSYGPGGYGGGNYNGYYYGQSRRPTLPAESAVSNSGRVMTPAPNGSGLWQERSTGRTCWGLNDCR